MNILPDEKLQCKLDVLKLEKIRHHIFYVVIRRNLIVVSRMWVWSHGIIKTAFG